MTSEFAFSVKVIQWSHVYMFCPTCVSLVFSSVAGGEKETHWKWHCYHSIPGRGWRIVVLQTVYDPIALHPYPSRGPWMAEKLSGNQRELWPLDRYHVIAATLKWYDKCDCVSNVTFPWRHFPDIFALVRYNSQNDSYRWVLWLTLEFALPWLKAAVDFIQTTLTCSPCLLSSQVEDILRGERSTVWTSSPVSACVYWSPRIQGLFISQM